MRRGLSFLLLLPSLLLIFLSHCQHLPSTFAIPHRFRPIPNIHWRDDDNEDSRSHKESGKETEIDNRAEVCGKYTKEFLRQASSQPPPVFGWLSADGVLPAFGGQANMTVRCLAVAVSARHMLVDKSCLRALHFRRTSPPLDNANGDNQPAVPFSPNYSGEEDNLHHWKVHWPRNGTEESDEVENAELEERIKESWRDEEDDTSETNWNGTMAGERDQHPNLAILRRRMHWRPDAPHSRRTRPFPCIFPIDDQLARKLSWNGTICGLNKSAIDQRIVCHPIKGMYSNLEPVEYHFSPGSTLFYFVNPSPASSFLGAVIAAVEGQQNKNNTRISSIGHKECAWLANVTRGQANCVDPSGMDEDGRVQRAAATDTAGRAGTPWAAQPNFNTLNERSSIGQAATQLPLIFLLTIVSSGMLLTIGYFFIIRQRRVYYDQI